ncbi:hypothetical protein ACJMK2_024781 [Sinanodonta woodiana]|uniref:Uncharacterized protein n=1 Tax=Sinanodonta woodiana TaxID=1069815 RepID=A0ABD3XI50_SINWO
MRKMTEPATTEEQKRFLQSLAGLKKPCVGLSAFKEYSGLFVSHGPGPTSTKPTSILHKYRFKCMYATKALQM